MENILDKSLTFPVCVAGARAGPSERPGTPDGYAYRLEHRERPWDEEHLMIETLAKFADAKPGQTVRDVIGDMDAFADAVSRVRAYYHNDPDLFERRTLNQQFQILATDDQSWRDYDDDDDYDSRDD